ncbi:MAG: hypothetical protein KC983_11615, partial [Phycisphaerales bacterium]|nr:hypothetical protein [Phycisphaerales bacterium]
TSDFLSGLIGSLPAMHELAEQAGIKLPSVLGTVEQDAGERVAVRSHDADEVEPEGLEPAT